jgi:hypothetical protein
MIFANRACVKRQVPGKMVRHGADVDLPVKSVKNEKDSDSMESNRR